MNANAVNFDVQNQLRPLPKAFNKKKFVLSYNVVNNPILSEIQNLSKNNVWEKIPGRKFKNQFMDDFGRNRHFYEVGRFRNDRIRAAGSF